MTATPCYDAATKNKIPGFETLQRGSDTVIIRPEWKDCLLEDLLDDFSRVAQGDRRTYAHGRAVHFSYQPSGGPGRVFVKHATRGGIVGSMMGNLYAALDRPFHELRASAVALERGVSVPEPLAVRATRVAGLFWKFTLVSREVEEASDLLGLAPSLPPERKRQLVESVADEMRRLHEAGVYHADITLKNILLSGSSVTIIDLDKARLRDKRVGSLDVENLARLNRSVEKLLGSRGLVTRADKLRFLRRYLGGREHVREFALRCASGLWFHRLWWALTGQARLPRPESPCPTA